MKKAIVIGCGVGGLGVIRSLGIEGFNILAMYYDRTDFAHVSKYVHEKIIIPNPRTEEREFVALMIKNSGKWKDALVIETNDNIATALSKNKEQLEKHYKIVTPEWQVLRRFIEKSETYRLAERCNVPYPKTLLPKTLDEIHDIKDGLNYPCILKPVVGHEFLSTFFSKIFKVTDPGELLAKFKLCSESGHEVMVQEIIPGPDSNIYECTVYISSNGNLNATFLSRKIRQNPPQFGVARVAISEGEIPQLLEFTERMLKEADFRGIAHAEFKKDPRDGQFKLLEVNGRILGSNWLTTYCGMNFPWIAYLDLVENKQIEVRDYQKNAYWIELYQDLSNSILRRSEDDLGLADYIRPYLAGNKTFGDISTVDFMPFLKRLSQWPIRHYKYSKWRTNNLGSG